MARRKTGPSRSSEDRMDFRLSSDHKDLIEKAAAYSGETLTGFAVATLVEEARRIVHEHETVAMTARDRDRFLELLDDPPAPSEALRRAAGRHKDLVTRSEQSGLPFLIEPLTRSHDRESFDCGEAELNEFLRRYARQNQERGLGRTYVAVPEDRPRVVGYYTLAAGSVEFAELPDDLRRRLPRYPVPVAHLARLATCSSVRGQGLGEVLLFDALLRTLQVAEEIGVVALEVRAKKDRARSFYEKYGFASLLDDPLHLYLPLATARQLVEP